jgi:uncharacterized protein (DUF1697 family)
MTQAPREAPRQARKNSWYVALLRGVNILGRNKLPMADLATLFTRIGCSQVATYIQSGNVCFKADPVTAQRLPEELAGLILDRFGFRVPVILRSAQAMRRIVAKNPFHHSGIAVQSLHVAFLTERPDPRRLAALDPQRSPGDLFAVSGMEVYLKLANGVSGTKFTNTYFDSVLGVTSTFRNWRTVQNLVVLTKSAS